MEFRFVEEQPMAGRERLVQPGAVVGRGGGDVELADPEVSRRHAMFRLVDGKPAVEDLSSRNGTFVNDRRADGLTVLGSGDRIRFGNTVWRVSLGAGSGTDRKNDRPPTALREAIPGEPHGQTQAREWRTSLRRCAA